MISRLALLVLLGAPSVSRADQHSPPPDPVGDSSQELYVLGTEVVLRAAPSRHAHPRAVLQVGTRVEKLADQQDWIQVRVRTGVEGWVIASLLTSRLPTLSWLHEQASLSSGETALLWLERARALEPWNVPILEQLSTACDRAGERRRAAQVRALLDPRGPITVGGCTPTTCGAWFSWSSETGYRASPPGGFDPALRSRSGYSGLFVLEQGRTIGYVTEMPTAIRPPGAPETPIDPLFVNRFLVTRLLRPPVLPPNPARHELEPLLLPSLLLKHLPEDIRATLALPGRPSKVRAHWTAAPAQEGDAVPLVIELELDCLELNSAQHLPARRAIVLLTAWDGGPMLRAPVVASVSSTDPTSHPPDLVFGLLDINGDARAEVIILEDRTEAPASPRPALWSFDPRTGWNVQARGQ